MGVIYSKAEEVLERGGRWVVCCYVSNVDRPLGTQGPWVFGPVPAYGVGPWDLQDL